MSEWNGWVARILLEFREKWLPRWIQDLRGKFKRRRQSRFVCDFGNCRRNGLLGVLGVWQWKKRQKKEEKQRQKKRINNFCNVILFFRTIAADQKNQLAILKAAFGRKGEGQTGPESAESLQKYFDFVYAIHDLQSRRCVGTVEVFARFSVNGWRKMVQYLQKKRKNFEI